MRDPVEALLRGHIPLVQDLSLRLRELVRSTVPQAQEHVYLGWNTICYQSGGGNDRRFCAIAPYKRSVNLYFQHGADLTDPDGLLQGAGKRMRHVKFNTPDELPRESLARLLRAALEALDA